MSEYKNTKFNTEPMIKEIENVVKKGMNLLLKDFMSRFELLEETHSQIMNLPSVKDHMGKNMDDSNYYKCNNTSYMDEDEDEDEDDEDDLNDYGKDSDKTIIQSIQEMTESIVKDEVKNQCGLLFQALNKIMNKIDKMESEMRGLKNEHASKNVVDLTIDNIKVKEEPVEKENIKLEIEEEQVEEEEEEEEQVEEQEEKVEEEEEQVEEEEEQVEEEEEEQVEEEQVEEEEEEQVEEEQVEEEEQDEEEQDEEEQVEEEEEQVEEEDQVETEAESEEEEEELTEIEIDDVTYCTNDEENGFIYELTEEGEQGEKVGYLKDGEPFFYADEK